MKDKDQEWAIFWCGLLRPVLYGDVMPAEVNGFLKELAQQEVTFPNGRRRKPSLSTLRRKLNTFRSKGFEGLARRERADKGKPRAFKKEILDKAEELKRDQGRRSAHVINKFLEEKFNKVVPPSTLYRHLKARGATRKKLGVEKTPVRKRWSRDHTHDLWVGDFEHGPPVLEEGTAQKTFLSAFIDAHSRYVVEARYYFKENLDILIDSLLRAWSAHGASLALYVDNAKVYHSKGLQAACFAIGIRKLSRRPLDPAGGGLIERFFLSAQQEFETEVRAGSILTLQELNRALSAWLEVSYHQRVHSETGQTPEVRYHLGLGLIRQVDTQEVLQFFMERVRRRVHKDFSDVQVGSLLYRVNPDLRKERVEVRYDPFSSLETVFIYSLSGEYLATGTLHQRETGQRPKTPPAQPIPQHSYIELLLREHQEKLKARAKGIDYRPVVSNRRWPFQSFAKKLAQLLARKGGLSAFSTDELDALRKVYNRFPTLDETSLVEAFEEADPKTIPSIVLSLQHLLQWKEDS